MNTTLLFLTILIATPLQEPQWQSVVIADDTRLPAMIEAIDEAGVRFVDESGTSYTNLQDVSEIQFNSSPALSSSEANLHLVGGSALVAEGILVDDSGMVTYLESGQGPVPIASRYVRSILFATPDQSQQEEWTALSNASDRTADWLIFDRNGALDYVQGKAGEITEESIQFNSGGNSGNAPRDRVLGLAYFHSTSRNMTRPAGILHTVTGSRIHMVSMKMLEPEKGQPVTRYSVVTNDGCVLELNVNTIAKIDFTSLRSRLLGSMNPSTIEWTPLLFNETIYEYQSRLNGPRFNQSFGNKPLQLELPDDEKAGLSRLVEFQTGIALKGGTRLVYQLQGQYSLLSGVIGFSPEAPQDGKVAFVVQGDGTDLYRQVLDNQIDEPQQIEIRINGTNRLSILVEYHDGRNIGDILHFCDARVIQ